MSLTRRKKALFLVVLMAFAFVGADTLHRVIAALTGEPWSPADARSAIERSMSALNDSVPVAGGKKAPAKGRKESKNIIHPYFGFEWKFDPFGVLDYFEKGRKTDEYVVLLLGGSVAAGCFWSHAESVKVLSADPRFEGREIKFLSWAHGAYKQPQQVNILVLLLSLGYKPDAIINLDGFNEVAVGNVNAANGLHPVYPAIGQWVPLLSQAATQGESLDRLVELRSIQQRATKIGERALRWKLHWSSILGHVARVRIESKRSDWAKLSQKHLGRLSEETLRNRMKSPKISARTPIHAGVRAWFQGSRSLAALCREREILYLHVLQPTLHDEGAKPVTDEERTTGTASDEWMEAVRVGYPMLRSSGERLAKLGVAYYDASRVFSDVKETLYFDSCHFKEAGQEILMRRIAEELLRYFPEGER